MRISDWSSDVCSSDLELRARAQTSGAIRALLALTPPQAHRLDAGDQEHDVALEDVRVGDRLRVRHGEKRSEEHTSELQSLMRISYAVFCWKKKKKSLLTKVSYRDHHHTLSPTVITTHT